MSDKQSQENIAKNIQQTGEHNVINFAPKQIGTNIETQILQVTTEVITQRELNTRSPYKGLKRFNFGDRCYFFGHDPLIKRLLKAINERSFTLVLGASGSGKSSLIRAGVIPEFQQSLGHERFYHFVFTPGQDPFVSLYRCLLAEDKDYSFDEEQVSFIRQGKPRTLERVLAELKQPDERWMIFIDQFEQLFTTCADDQRRKNFIDNVVSVANRNDGTSRLVLAMRSDFLEQFSFYSNLGTIANDNMHLVTEMYPDQLREAIEQPAALHGVVFEPGLVNQIIKEVEGQSGYLPLLQYTLNLLWEYECKTIEADGKPSIRDRHLNKSSYRALEGVRGALQKRINDIYIRLDQDGKLASKQIFLKLANIVETEAGSRAVSRKAYLDEFSEGTQSTLLQKFINENILVSTDETLKTGFGTAVSEITYERHAVIELAHEIILSSWDELKSWLEEEKEAIILKNWLANETYRWLAIKEKNEDKAKLELLRGTRLEQVADLQGKNGFQKLGGLTENENQFLNESLKERARKIKLEQERQRKELEQERKARRAAQSRNLILLVSMAAMIVVGAIAWFQSRQRQFLEVTRDVLVGKVNPELTTVLPDLLQEANKLKESNDIDNALEFYRGIITYIDQLNSQKKLQNTGISEDENAARLVAIRTEAEQSLIEIIQIHKLPQIEKALSNGQIGEIASSDFSSPDTLFTSGALKETYITLMIDVGADINNSGLIINMTEANRLPCEILKQIEELWLQYSDQQCAWYGASSKLRDPDCEKLPGETSLLTAVFPINAQSVDIRLSECGFAAPDPFAEGVRTASKAAELTQTAQSPDDWLEVTRQWNVAVQLMMDVPVGHNQYELAQSRVPEYKKNRNYAFSNVSSSSSSAFDDISSLEIQTSPIQIVSGFGWITDSSAPAYIPPNTIFEATTGGYLPEQQKLIIEFEPIYVHLILEKPLSEGQEVRFFVEKVVLLRTDNNPQMAYPSIRTKLPGVYRPRIEEASGSLKKEGAIIMGTLNGSLTFDLWKSSKYTSNLNAKFSLAIEPGLSDIFQIDFDRETNENFIASNNSFQISDCDNCGELDISDFSLSNLSQTAHSLMAFRNLNGSLNILQTDYLNASDYREINRRIINALIEMGNFDTSGGPEDGKLACAWAINRILQHAGISTLGTKTNFVPDLELSLLTGRGAQIAQEHALPGDIAIVPDADHIGVCIENGCKTVHSNSSSKQTFSWISDFTFGGRFKASEIRVYRLLN